MAWLTPAQRATLLGNDWFAGLPEAARDEALDLAVPRRLREGERLYGKDGEGDAWFGIAEGAIRLGATAPDGRQGLLAILEPGTWFGDTSLLDGLPRPHDAVAHAPTMLLAVARPQFEALLERYPVLYRHFVQLHCRRARLMYLALEAWTAYPLDERLARHLQHLARGHGRRVGEDVAIELHLPQEQLAQLLGVSRQRVSQLLRDWEQHGRLHFRYGRIVLSGEWLGRREAAPLLPSSRREAAAFAPH
jgi:CRP-like cAMP-binding protein